MRIEEKVRKRQCACEAPASHKQSCTNSRKRKELILTGVIRVVTGIHLVVRASFTEPNRFSNTSMVKVLHCTSSVAVRVNGDTAPSLLPCIH